jgi:LCP family protein required for cell wall assembly
MSGLGGGVDRGPVPVQPRMPKRRRGWLQRLVLLGGVVSSVSLATSAAGFAYLYRKAEQIPRVELSSVLTEPEVAGDPQNYLIVGVDNADGLPEDDPVRNARDSQMLNDVVMVLRIYPSERKAELLSLPRDLWVPYNDTGDNARINTAISRGGGRPDVLIGVMRDYLGIPIHHYVQVEFAGFRELVAAIDGVPVYFPYPARDTRSGLSVLETGCVTLDPVQALAYARARHYDELIDGEWVRDPRSDLGRIARQQDFIRRALDRAVSKGARNPGTLDRLLDAALGSVTIDDELTTGDIFDLAQRFREFDPDSLKTYTVVVERTFKGAADVVLLMEAESEPILARFRGDASEEGDAIDPGEDGSDDDGSDDDGSGGSGEGDDEGSGGGDGDDETTGISEGILPASVRLTVRNGSGVNGQAMDAADGLTGAGFIVVGRGEEPGFGVERTVVRYPEGRRAEAELVSRWLVSGADLEEVPGDDGEGVVVVTGTDWSGVRTDPAPAMPPQDDPTDDDPTGSGSGGSGAGTGDDEGDGGGSGAGDGTGADQGGSPDTTGSDPNGDGQSTPLGGTTTTTAPGTDGAGDGSSGSTSTTSTTVPPAC